VAETSAADTETIIDDQDHPTDYECELPVMTPCVQCKPCARLNNNILFLALRRLDRHTTEQHADACASRGDAPDAASVSRRYVPLSVTFPSTRGQPSHVWPSNASCAETHSAQPQASPNARDTHDRNSGTGGADKRSRCPSIGPEKLPPCERRKKQTFSSLSTIASKEINLST